MQPEASDSPATRPKASHCRRERRAVTSRSLPPECPAWVSPSAHPEMSCRPGAGPAAHLCASFAAISAAHAPLSSLARPVGLTALAVARVGATTEPRVARAGSRRHHDEGGNVSYGDTWLSVCCFGLDASARRRERRARRMRRIGDPSHRRVRATRWPNRGHARSGSARHQLETSELEKTCWPSEPSGRPFQGTPRGTQPMPPPTHKPTTKQPFENLLSEKKRTVNLFLRSLLLG